MGITNFSTYVQRALKWSTPLYRAEDASHRSLAGRAFASYTLDDGKSEFERNVNGDVSGDETGRGVDYIRQLFDEVCCETSDTQRDGSTVVVVGTPGSVADGTGIYGICVDLASFCYTTIIREVTDAIRRDNESTNPEPKSVTDSETTVSGNGNVTVAFDSKKRKSEDAFEESERHARQSDPPVRNAANGDGAEDVKEQRHEVMVLNEESIESCATKCATRIFDTIGLDVMLHAHYVLLHFDENTTSCKWYEQHVRRNTCASVIDRDSRQRIFEEIIGSVERRLVRATELRIELLSRRVESIESTTVEGTEELVRSGVREGVVKRAIEEKMQLTRRGDVNRGRHVNGEGEWKCFYGIRDLECGKEQKGTERCSWYIFGNDSDIGLGVLLYSSETTRAHYVNGCLRVLSVPEDFRWDVADVYKALHFFSLNLLGNDYVPRTVNESDRNIACLGAEVSRVLSSDDKICLTYAHRLGHLFGDSTRACRLCKRHEESNINREVDVARAIAYVLSRLLVAVYDSDRNVSYWSVTEESSDRRGVATDVTSLRCNDGVRRSFTECFDVIAIRLLWYMAYCLFYRNMNLQQRNVFREGDSASGDCPLNVHGLSMKTQFTYNDRRLRDAVRFRLTNLVDVRRAVRELTTPHLVRILESGISNVLNV